MSNFPYIVHAQLPYAVRSVTTVALPWIFAIAVILHSLASFDLVALTLIWVASSAITMCLIVFDYVRYNRRVDYRPPSIDHSVNGIEYSRDYDDLFHGLELRGSFLRWLIGPRRHGSEMFQQVRALGLRRPSTIVDSGLIHDIAAVDVPRQLLEPEIIVARPQWREIAAIALISGATVFMVTDMWSAGFAISALVACLLCWRRVWSLVCVALPRLDYRVVAGVGVVSDWFGRRTWRSDASLMIVQKNRRGRSVHVTLMGETYTQYLDFSCPRDSAFVKLWKHWNHPSPRYELGLLVE